PFSSADENGFVNYRATETLYFNEFWYEYEEIEAGNEITFSVQSSPSDITFAIWNQPFENLGTTIDYIDVLWSTSLINGEYWAEWLFLRPGSLIQYDFNASGPIDFFIADGNDFYLWDQGSSPSFYVDLTSINQSSGSLPITIAQDYYIVWYNDGGPSINIDYTVNYTAAGVIDFSSTYETREAVDFVAQDTFTVPQTGNWYFFVYFDPMNDPEESTLITFDVTYDTGITSQERWIDIQWILIIILVVVVILLIAAVISRRGQKKLKLQEPVKTTPKSEKTPDKKVPSTELKCIRCGASLHADSKFCAKCGGKVEGRTVGSSTISTPINSKNCSLCGSKLSGTEKFCKWCGTKVEK
ncbi:MAG: zinc ribbon domain-containing protein, partial [Candidatus Kariarchaeaceae archaeon]